MITFRVCFHPVKICKIFQKGTKVIIDVVCESNHKYSLHSQPNENGRAAENISIAALIVLSGETFERLKEIFQTALIHLLVAQRFTRYKKS